MMKNYMVVDGGDDGVCCYFVDDGRLMMFSRLVRQIHLFGIM